MFGDAHIGHTNRRNYTQNWFWGCSAVTWTVFDKMGTNPKRNQYFNEKNKHLVPVQRPKKTNLINIS